MIRCAPGAGREPRRSWEQGRTSAELRAASTPEARTNGVGPLPARTSQQRVSFDERAIANGGSGRGSGAAVDSTQTLSDGPSSLSSAWPPLGSDRRSSGSGTIWAMIQNPSSLMPLISHISPSCF
jgi:hypothetical protein